MKVFRCEECHERGGHLVFRETKNNKRKYSYVGHYDPTKKSKRRWCYLNSTCLNNIDFDAEWFDKDYSKLIWKIQSVYNQKGKTPMLAGLVLKAARLLEKNGFLIYRIAERLEHDVSHVFVTEKEIEGFLDERFNDKTKKKYTN